jgi:sugar phosphate isomerase/epimerase
VHDVAHPRLSLNQWTTRRWSLAEAIDGCVGHGIGGIGVWREKLAELPAGEARTRLDDAGLTVSSLCRGGFLSDAGTHATALDDNRRALDEAVDVGADLLVLVMGGLPAGSTDLAAARIAAQDGLAALVPYAVDAGVRLALEPLHPMYAADRCVLSTLRQAVEWAEPFAPSAVGVCVDTFHVWWDPEVTSAIEAVASAGRLATFQVCDFLVPLPADVLLGRGYMGDGVIDFEMLTRSIAATGYGGFVEVEIFNADVWADDPDTVCATVSERFDRLVAPYL